MKRRLILIIAGISLVVMAAAAGVIWYLSSQPLYEPGMVSRGEGLDAPLEPPPQLEGLAAWVVEPGIELAHFAQGTGRNVLVVHGGPGMPFSKPLPGLGPLTGTYRFHYYDQRGCGESTRPIDRFESRNMYENIQALDRTLGLGAQLADIERIRRILGDEQLILVGHSWGGFLASLYAAEFPERVAALVLVAPANVLVMPQPDAESDLYASVRARLPAGKQEEFDAFMADYMDFNALFEQNEAQLVQRNLDFGEYYARALGAELTVEGRPGGWMVWAQYLSMGRRHDYRPALAQVQAPVLVIHGAGDMQSEAASRLYAESFPQAEFEVIEAAGHFSFDQQPDQFAPIVEKFLAGL